MDFEDYRVRFSVAALTRDEAGVVTVRLHSKGEALWWGGRPHRELPELFECLGADRSLRAVILTGTGESFITLLDSPKKDFLARGESDATDWERRIAEGNRLISRFVEIEVPVIAAVNGPVTVHSELPVLCDIVLTTPDTYFQDLGHVPLGLVPGDSVQIVWPMLLGPNRGRAFLMLGQQLHAEEAQRLGVVTEIVERDALLARANEIAGHFAQQNPVLLRHTRYVLNRPIRRALMEDLHVGLAYEAIGSLSGKEWYAQAQGPGE